MKRAAWMLIIALSLLGCAAQALQADAEQVEKLLARMTCPGACTYVVAIINTHPQERDALLAMDEAALPALADVLTEGERGLKTSMAEIFVDEILSRRRDAEPTAADEDAKAALAAYTGKEYAAHAPNPEWAGPEE